jgi:hypothetical protein
MTIRHDIQSSATNGDDRKIKEPDDVTVMLRLSRLGWGAQRIARELGCQRNTVKKYLKQGGLAAVRVAVSCFQAGWASGLAGRALREARW